jgi:hypothetical protein
MIRRRYQGGISTGQYVISLLSGETFGVKAQAI